MATAIHQYEDKLLDFAYGELPAPEASAVESHLKSCPRCSEALNEIRGVRASMSALPQEPAPTAGLESLLAYAEQAAQRAKAGPRAQLPWWRRMIAPAAGVCALALVGVVAWRTQSEMDFSPQTAALEAQHQNDRASEVASAPAPLALKPDRDRPVAMNIGEAEDDARQKKEDRNWDLGAKKRALAKNGYGQELGGTRAPEELRQKELGDSLGIASKQSSTRRAGGKDSADPGTFEKKVLNENRYDDYSNAKQRGAKVYDKEEMPKTAAAPAAAKPSAVSPPAAPVPPPVEQAPRPSMGLGLGSSSGSVDALGSGRGSANAPSRMAPSEDESAAQGVSDRKRFESDVTAQRVAEERQATGYLEAARAASNSGDRQQEVKLALAVLDTKVQGYPRAEALQRVCTALEALGEEGQADKYCAQLLREFPNTAAAKMVAQRRSRTQKSKALSNKAPLESAPETAPAAEPAKAKKATKSAADAL
jgi:hypothetical protein